MQESYKEIAPRLVGLRDSLDITINEMSEILQIDAETVALYESAKVEIPVGYLLQVSKTFSMDLMALISGDESRLRNYSIVKKGLGLNVDRRESYDYQSLASRFTGRKMEPFYIKVPPKERADMKQVAHKGQEFIYMLEGRLEILLNDEYHILEVGDSLYFNSKTPHAIRGLDNKEAHFIDIIL